MDGWDSDRSDALSRTDNPLVRAIGRVPATVQRKLLVALAIVAALLVTVGVLGLRVLSDSNDRVGALGLLPQREATYGELLSVSGQLNSLFQSRDNYAACLIAPNPATCVVGGAEKAHYIIGLAQADGAIDQALNQLSPLTIGADLGFVPPPSEQSILSKIRSEYLVLTVTIGGVLADDAKGTYGIVSLLPTGNALSVSTPASSLESDASQLVSIAQADTGNLIAQNQAAYLDSQHLVIGVAAGSVVLALLLGLALSWSLTGPIRQMRARLAAIASGDFSGHLEVSNRDELGALAADLNRTNDQLGRLYQEVENASRHKSEFLANMSHELRTPLNAVIGFSEVLQDRLFGDLNEKQAEYVADIHTSGRHLLTLINDILDLSKIEAGRMDPQVAPFALSDVVQNSVALLRERATRQGIALGFDVDPSIGVIEADERMIKQVLFNLLSNALKFTGPGGHVDVTARGHADGVLVSVHDDGVGIAEADQARIFEEFQQVGTAHLQEGTGLGLAISRRFIELHGGTLRVDSEPGNGSTFTFTLPRTQDSAVVPDPDGALQPAVTRTKRPAAAPLP
jgi:signal transduction histidine kinase